jgi:hypothetical protein
MICCIQWPIKENAIDDARWVSDKKNDDDFE